MKFGRTYRLNIQVSDVSTGFAVVGGQVVPVQGQGSVSVAARALNIAYPLTLYMDVSRGTLSSANKGFFKIMNLSEDSRRQIFHDRFDTQTYRSLVLTAGYEDDPKLPVIFRGNVLFAQSFRVKQDWVTEIEALDGGFGIINGQVSTSLDKNVSLRSAISAIISTLPKIAEGAVGDVGSDQRSRGLILMGNSWDTLNGIAPDANVFVDNEKAYVLNKNEFIDNGDGPFLISSNTGLLDTPRRGQNTLEIKIMFEPRIYVGQLVQIESIIPYYNGVYAVQSVSHRGIISGAMGGDLTTNITVFTGTKALKGVTPDFAGVAA